jgi:hypothetical protein
MSNPSAKPQGRQTPSATGYEKRDAHAKGIFGVVAFLLFAGLIMHFCLAGLMERLNKTPVPADQWTGSRRGAGAIAASKAVPHLQISPAVDLEKFREREAAELSTYGWIDRTAGVVRIPIARAMDLVLERGLPVRSQTNASGLGPSSYQLQQQRPQSPQPEIQGEK